jgi:preprotein translocase subunit SecB
MPTQLSPSPLAILNHEFTEIILKASEDENPSAPLSLDFGRNWEPSPADPLVWRLILTVTFGGEDPDAAVPYRGQLTAVGDFQIVKEYPEENRDSLIRITGASILYGACREMLTNLTARAPHGMISLPSISFVDSAARKKKAVKKRAAKTPKKKAPKKK